MEDFEDLSNLSYSCPNATEEEIDFLYFTNWFLNGIIQLIICLTGKKMLCEGRCQSREKKSVIISFNDQIFLNEFFHLHMKKV